MNNIKKSCDDNVDDVIAKSIKKRIMNNKFTLVNMGTEKFSLVCILKKETGDSEEAREIRNSDMQDWDTEDGWKFLLWA